MVYTATIRIAALTTITTLYIDELSIDSSFIFTLALGACITLSDRAVILSLESAEEQCSIPLSRFAF
jgi:hypothetical protein